MVQLPDTKIIQEAKSIASAALTPEIYYHSIRSFHFACEYAKKFEIRFSEEKLALSSLFHDLGLSTSYYLDNKPFQFISSKALKDFLLHNNYSHRDRIHAMMEAIDFHFQFKPRWDKSNIAGLLQTGTHMDVLGKKSKLIEENIRKEILNKFPKNNFFLEFNLCVFKKITGVSSFFGLFLPEKFLDKNHYSFDETL